MNHIPELIIAIDGYSSCGKSTFAILIARETGYRYIDSGAMYRAVTLYCLENHISDKGKIDTPALIKSLDDLHIDFVVDKRTGNSEIRLNKKIVEDRIRTLEVSSLVSKVSTISEVRRKMGALQYQMGKEKAIVMDGRDIGTVIFPHADIKIFMTADPHVRALRRFNEMKEKGLSGNLDEIEKNIMERDLIDTTRADSPLKKAEDAFMLDNTNMTPDEQMEWFRELIKNIQTPVK